MRPLAILLIGVAIVIGGILGLRLHAFLALTLAAIVAAALTPSVYVERTEMISRKIKVLKTEASEIVLLSEKKHGLRPGARCFLTRLPDLQSDAETFATIEIERLEKRAVNGKEANVAVGRLVSSEFSSAAIPSDSIVIQPADLGAARSLVGKNIGERVGDALGSTAA